MVVDKVQNKIPAKHMEDKCNVTERHRYQQNGCRTGDSPLLEVLNTSLNYYLLHPKINFGDFCALSVTLYQVGRYTYANF